jgi:ParB-like chromosome segregation protein Spo0J
MNQMNIDWVNGSDLKSAPWRSVYILKPDLEVLAKSLNEYGWLQPILVQKSTGRIIDGNYRWQIAANFKGLHEKHDGLVPVVWVECDDIDAQLMHLRLNRGRGNIFAKQMSRILKTVIRSKKYTEKELKQKLMIKADEMDLLLDGSLIKTRKVAEHKYSAAWVPVEAPSSFTEPVADIERPPNSDR